MSQVPTIVIGADHAGFKLKEQLVAHLKSKSLSIHDVGCFSEESVDYPAIGGQLAEALKKLEAETGAPVRGVLCCGSGIGIGMSANRFPWIRAVVAHDHNTAVMSRRHNDANVICFGGRVIAPELAAEILDTWLATPFDGGRHQKRLDQMSRMGQMTAQANGISVENQGAPTC